MKLTDLIKIGKETISVLYPEREAGEMVFAYMEETLGTKRHTHIVEPEYEVPAGKAEAAQVAFERMAAGEPLQYVIGKAWFYGRQFNVSPDVLIPRPETEVLCDRVVRLNQGRQVGKVLDLCTGSGCIAWTLALEMPGADVTAVDISDGALRVASSQDFSEEAARTGALAPTFVKADVLKGPENHFQEVHKTIVQPDMLTSDVDGRYDVIVSNPPYVCLHEAEEMERNVLDYEPHQALFVPDTDPLIFYRAIASFALSHLVPKGWLCLEINQAFPVEMTGLLASFGFRNITIIPDQYGKKRIACAQL